MSTKIPDISLFVLQRVEAVVAAGILCYGFDHNVVGIAAAFHVAKMRTNLGFVRQLFAGDVYGEHVNLDLRLCMTLRDRRIAVLS